MRAPPDVRLRELLHPDGRHHAGVDAVLLEHVLQRERVDDRAEHPHVVGGDAVHAHAGRAARRARCCRRRSPGRRRTPMSTTALISSAKSIQRSKSKPMPFSPASASPESLSRTRGYGRRRLKELLTPRPSGSGRSGARECSRRLRRSSLTRSPMVFFGSRTQGCSMRQCPCRTTRLSRSTMLLDDVLRLAARLGLLLGDPALALDHLGRHSVLVDRNGSGARNVQRDVLRRAP